PVEIGLVVSDDVLLGTREGAAYLEGSGAIPAELARELAKDAGEAGAAKGRRLYPRPRSGQVVALASRRRCFDGALARFTRLRDETCRVPWCDAPIRHIDHPQQAAADGKTSDTNAQGLCEACNYTKEAVGWRVRVVETEPHTV